MSDRFDSDNEGDTPTASPLKGPLGTPTQRSLPTYQRRRRKLWKVARSPWYTSQGRRKEPLVIGVTGGTASGKTTVCRKIIERIGIPWVVMISMDRFYRSLPPEEMKLAKKKEFNWDHPSAFDWALFQKVIADIRTGKSVEVPRYDFATNSREKETDTVYGADIVIIEGILVLHDKPLRELMDIKVFVDTDSDLRLARRIKRDIRERGRTVDEVLDQYVKTVKPSFDDYIFPTKRYADLIVPRGGDNYVAINLLVQHIKAILKKRGISEGHGFRLKMSKLGNVSKDKLIQLLPATVTILPPTAGMRALHTVMRNKDTTPLMFRRHVHRVGRLIMAKALDKAMELKVQGAVEDLSLPPTRRLLDVSPLDSDGFSLGSPVSVQDRAPSPDVDREGSVQQPKVVGVSIVRGGQALEVVLKEFLPEAKIGKIIIAQSRDKAYGPRLYYCSLPRQIHTAPVILMDPVLATSNTCEMAMRILLEHGIPEEQIILAVIIAAPEGLLSFSRNFPKVRIVCSWVDQGLDSRFFVTPGIGFFGARYFNCGDISSSSKMEYGA
uniref:Uridine kinase n=1 Tax=Lotharella globosa TaxID=91324 RepID=A0A7S3ZBN8_9EUKA